MDRLGTQRRDRGSRPRTALTLHSRPDQSLSALAAPPPMGEALGRVSYSRAHATPLPRTDSAEVTADE